MALEGTDEYLIFMASTMWVKFQKYWADFSVILAIACILDPQYKMPFVELCYKKAHGEDSLEILVVCNKLQSLFDEYKSKSSHLTTIYFSSRANESSSHPKSMETKSDLLKIMSNHNSTFILLSITNLLFIVSIFFLTFSI